MTKIFEPTVAFLEANRWDFVKDVEDNIIHTGYQGRHDNWQCYARAREEQNQLVFYSIAPTRAPIERREAVALYLMHVNYGLILGYFELDLSDGEVRFKTSLDIGNHNLTNSLIKPVIFTNVSMMDKYWPAIKSIIDGTSLEEVVALLDEW